MFTGLVECVGIVARAEGTSPRRLTIGSSLPSAETKVGDSVAIDGCCLTVVEARPEALTFEAATETLERTTLGALRQGARVNLERALRVGDRLGGHLVSGHVDGVGVVRRVEQRGSARYVTIQAPADVARLTAGRGSITVAGVSLTVTAASGEEFTVGLIPHTLAATTFDALVPGSRVNLEADLLARYVERLLQSSKHVGLTEEFLTDSGFA